MAGLNYKVSLHGVDHNYPYIFIHIQYVFIVTFIFSSTSKISSCLMSCIVFPL